MSYRMNPSGFPIDVIGDVHGNASRLRALLASMGYETVGGAWRHPERLAVFIGDLIDRGPEQLETVDIVRRMVDAGSGVLLMGNHEFNAIGYATARASGIGHLRERGPGNTFQHSAFIAATGLDTPLHRELVAWMTTLPTHLTIDGYRFTHACWDEKLIDVLGGPASGHIDAERLETFFDTKTAEGKAAEIVLKGPEAKLPPGVTYRDNYGIERKSVRLAWWRREALTMRQMAVVEDVGMEALDALPSPEAWRTRGKGPLTFVGHYWMQGEPAPVSDDVVCVDFSVAKDGVLAAYRLEPGDVTARPDRFVWV